jgi:hypothetical protein
MTREVQRFAGQFVAGPSKMSFDAARGHARRDGTPY